jgi:hypothetical protein
MNRININIWVKIVPITGDLLLDLSSIRDVDDVLRNVPLKGEGFGLLTIGLLTPNNDQSF